MIKRSGAYRDRKSYSDGVVLLCETSQYSNTINPNSGMINPQLIDGTASISFSNIPQHFKDIKLVFSQMAHNTNNTTGYRIVMNLNGDTTNNRYYTRAGFRATGSGGNTSVSAPTWNADNTNSFYYGYVYRPENVTWTGSGEVTFPSYSVNSGWSRSAYGNWYHLNQSDYNLPYGFNYYNGTTMTISSINLSLESSVAFRQNSKISLYGIG